MLPPRTVASAGSVDARGVEATDALAGPWSERKGKDGPRDLGGGGGP